MKLLLSTLLLATVSTAAPSGDDAKTTFNMGHVELLRNISHSLDSSMDNKKTQHAKILEVSKTQHQELLQSRTKLQEELKNDRAAQFKQIMDIGDSQHEEMKILLEQIMKNIESTDSFKLGQEHLDLIKKIQESLVKSTNDNTQHNTELQNLYKQQHAELKNLKTAETKQITDDRNRQFQILKQKSAQQEEEIKKMLKTLLSKLDQPRNCHELYSMGIRNSGVYLIKPQALTENAFVYCDMDYDGGWTVIQRRNFYAEEKAAFMNTWQLFKTGFGKLTGEFWLGNEIIHQMTKEKPYELKVEMRSFDNVTSHASYSSFQVESEATSYRIRITGSPAGQKDTQFVLMNNHYFAANDKRNGCSTHWGGWWYNGCNYVGNLNGYHGNTKNYQYITFDGSTPLSHTVMKIKPSSK